MRRILVLGLLVLLAVGAASGLNSDLSNLDKPEPPILHDFKGGKMTGNDSQNSSPLELSDISDYVEMAVVATEDQKFYSHHGFDLSAIFRAMWVNILAGRVKEGGSTISQQTAKTLYLTQDRTLVRKVKEIAYTLALEKKYSKQEILALYLDNIYYGNGATGIEAAADTYFGKSPADLNLAESALLVTIPRRPSYYDPYRYPDHAKQRQKVVLTQMVEQGMITDQEALDAERSPIVYKPK